MNLFNCHINIVENEKGQKKKTKVLARCLVDCVLCSIFFKLNLMMKISSWSQVFD